MVNLGSQLRHVGVISLVALQGVFVASWAQVACYDTPRIAIAALEQNSSVSLASVSSGYRVTRLQSDPVLGQRWATLVSCGHPERPALALRASGASSLRASQEVEPSLSEGVKTAPLIRAGDIVRLWRQENLLRIEVVGVSEESGSLGKTIRVRLLRRNTDDQSMPEQLFGVVRGPSNVEIQP
jgi:hypothetical protein